MHLKVGSCLSITFRRLSRVAEVTKLSLDTKHNEKLVILLLECEPSEESTGGGRLRSCAVKP